MSPGSAVESSQINQIVLTECTRIVEECYGAATSGELDLTAVWQADVQEALRNSDVDLLQCGYERRTMIIVPSNGESSETIDGLKRGRPTAAVIPVEVDESFVLCEGAGINASSLARRFERVYPGIAEAARRLFTRIDINWAEKMP